MRRTILALTIALSASTVFAATPATDYRTLDLNGPATNATVSQEITRVNEYTYGNSLAIQSLGGRADDTDLALIGQGQRNDQQDVRLNGHDAQFANQDAVNAALSSKLNGMYTDTAGLRSEVRNARREAKEAKAGAAAALAVAGQQFDIHGGFQTSISASTLGGYQGVAIGAGGALSERVFVNAAFTTSSSQTGAVVAGTYSW